MKQKISPEKKTKKNQTPPPPGEEVRGWNSRVFSGFFSAFSKGKVKKNLKKTITDGFCFKHTYIHKKRLFSHIVS